MSKYDFIHWLPEFGESFTITGLLNEIDRVPEQIEALLDRRAKAEAELDRIIAAFWTYDEISVAKEGRYV